MNAILAMPLVGFALFMLGAWFEAEWWRDHGWTKDDPNPEPISDLHKKAHELIDAMQIESIELDGRGMSNCVTLTIDGHRYS